MKRMALMFSALLTLLAGCSPTGAYSQKDGKWLFETREVLAVPPGETLKPLNNRFAKSATAAFFRSTRIDGAHAPSFEAFSGHYAKDRARVYYGETYRKGQEYYAIVHTRIAPIPGADAASFKYLDQGYGKDKARVYFNGSPFTADAATYQVLDYGFGKDAVNGYYMREPIPGSDGKTFSNLDDNWSKDARRVFWSDVDLNSQPAGANINRIVEGADPATFTALEGDYGKDAKHVFYQGKLVEGADPATFEVIDPATDKADARDKARTYREGKP